MIDDTIDQICTVQEVKDFLQLDTDQHDDMIEKMIDASISYAEMRLGYNICEKKFQLETNKTVVKIDKNPFVKVEYINKNDKFINDNFYSISEVHHHAIISFQSEGDYKIIYIAGVHSAKISPIIKRTVIDHVALMYNEDQSLSNLSRIEYYYNQFRNLKF